MMIRCPLIIFLAFIILLACSQTPSGESTQKPSVGMGAPPPPTEDFGVSCFVEFGDSITCRSAEFPSLLQFGRRLHLGGSIRMNRPWAGRIASSRKGPWELWASPDGTVRYQFNPGKAMFSMSTDGGASWQNILDLEDIRLAAAKYPRNPVRKWSSSQARWMP